jgi:hypothetical protein
MNLTHSKTVIGNMLQQMIADNNIYGAILKRNMLYVEVHVGKW